MGGIWCLACAEPNVTADAGSPDAQALDAGAADAGASDAGVAECPDRCPGQCLGLRCIERPSDCTGDNDCAGDARCSASGFCYEGACLSHDDCPAGERCATDRCVPRVDNEVGVMFERVQVPALHAHNSALIAPETGWPVAGAAADMGFGAALFDVDGDLDLDLFIGSQGQDIGGSPACIYRNESTPAQLRFVPDPAFCQPHPTDLAAGFGTDLNGDGYHELITTGLFVAQVHIFHPERRVIDLLALLPEDDPRRRCFASSALSTDLNWDGVLDLVIGCAVGPMDERIGVDEVSYRNLAFLFDASGNPRLLERSKWNRNEPILLEAQGITLGLGAADLNDDGLLDLMVSEDRRIMGPDADYLDPGGAYIRCAPGSTCRFRPQRFGVPGDEYGAYMGSGLLHLAGRGEHVYVTNETDNRLLQFEGGETIDRARALGVELAYMGQQPIFSWGVVVDDFNRDGLDDLFISNGAVMSPEIDAFYAHFDAIFMQNEQGFSLHSGDLGIAPFTFEDSLNEDRPYSSRAALKADLDGDGYLDLIGVGLEGRPRLHREVPHRREDTPRCTLVPLDRYVPGYGIGHTLISPQGDERRWDSQGQNRSGASPFVLSPWARGKLRFASGAEVPFNCEDSPGPIVVSEPEWLVQTLEGDRLRVVLSPDAPAGSRTLALEPSGETLTLPGGLEHTVALPAGTERWMLRFGERWLARRFLREELNP